MRDYFKKARMGARYGRLSVTNGQARARAKAKAKRERNGK